MMDMWGHLLAPIFMAIISEGQSALTVRKLNSTDKEYLYQKLSKIHDIPKADSIISGVLKVDGRDQTYEFVFKSRSNKKCDVELSQNLGSGNLPADTSQSVVCQAWKFDDDEEKQTPEIAKNNETAWKHDVGKVRSLLTTLLNSIKDRNYMFPKFQMFLDNSINALINNTEEGGPFEYEQEVEMLRKFLQVKLAENGDQGHAAELQNLSEFLLEVVEHLQVRKAKKGGDDYIKQHLDRVLLTEKKKYLYKGSMSLAMIIALMEEMLSRFKGVSDELGFEYTSNLMLKLRHRLTKGEIDIEILIITQLLKDISNVRLPSELPIIKLMDLFKSTLGAVAPRSKLFLALHRFWRLLKFRIIRLKREYNKQIRILAKFLRQKDLQKNIYWDLRLVRDELWKTFYSQNGTIQDGKHIKLLIGAVTGVLKKYEEMEAILKRNRDRKPPMQSTDFDDDSTTSLEIGSENPQWNIIKIITNAISELKEIEATGVEANAFRMILRRMLKHNKLFRITTKNYYIKLSNLPEKIRLLILSVLLRSTKHFLISGKDRQVKKLLLIIDRAISQLKGTHEEDQTYNYANIVLVGMKKKFREHIKLMKNFMKALSKVKEEPGIIGQQVTRLIDSIGDKENLLNLENTKRLISGTLLDIQKIKPVMKNDGLLSQIETRLTNVRDQNNLLSGVHETLLYLLHVAINDYTQNRILEKNYVVNSITRKDEPKLSHQIVVIIQRLKEAFREKLIKQIDEDLLALLTVNKFLKDEKLVTQLITTLNTLKGSADVPSEVYVELLPLLHRAIDDYLKNRVLQKDYIIDPVTWENVPELSQQIYLFISVLENESKKMFRGLLGKTRRDFKKIVSSLKVGILVDQIERIMRTLEDDDDDLSSVGYVELVSLLHDAIKDYKQSSISGKNYTISPILKQEQPRLSRLMDRIIQGLKIVFKKNLVDLIDKDLEGIKEMDGSLLNESLTNEIKMSLTKLNHSTDQSSEIQQELFILLHKVFSDYKWDQLIGKHYNISPVMRKKEPRLSVLIISVILELKKASREKSTMSLDEILPDIRNLKGTMKNDPFVIDIRNPMETTIHGELSILNGTIEDYKKDAILEENCTINPIMENVQPSLNQHINRIIRELKLIFSKNVVDLIEKDLRSINEIGSALGEEKLMDDFKISLKGISNQTSETQLELLIMLHDVTRDYNHHHMMENQYTINPIMRQEQPRLSGLVADFIHKLRDSLNKKTAISVFRDIKRLESSLKNVKLVNEIRTILKNIVDINDTSGRVQGQLLPLLHDVISDFMENVILWKNYTISPKLRNEEPRLCQHVDDIIQGLKIAFKKYVMDLDDDDLRGIKEIEGTLGDDKLVNDIKTLLIKLKGRSSQTTEVQLELLLLLHEVIKDYKGNRIMENHYTISPLMRQDEPRLTGLIVDIIQKLRDASNTKIMISVDDILRNMEKLKNYLKNDRLMNEIRTLIKNIVDIKDTSGRVQGELLPILHSVINDYVENAILRKNYTVSPILRREEPRLCQDADDIIQGLKTVFKKNVVDIINEDLLSIKEIGSALGDEELSNDINILLIKLKSHSNWTSEIQLELLLLLHEVIKDYKRNRIMENHYTISPPMKQEEPRLTGLIVDIIQKLRDASNTMTIISVDDIHRNMEKLKSYLKNDQLMNEIRTLLKRIVDINDTSGRVQGELIPMLHGVFKDYVENAILRKNYTVSPILRRAEPRLCQHVDDIIEGLKIVFKKNVVDLIDENIRGIKEIESSLGDGKLSNDIRLLLIKLKGRSNKASEIQLVLLRLLHAVIRDHKQNQKMENHYTISPLMRQEEPLLSSLIVDIIQKLRDASNTKTIISVDYIHRNMEKLKSYLKNDRLINEIRTLLKHIVDIKDTSGRVQGELLPMLNGVIKDYVENAILRKNYTVSPILRRAEPRLCQHVDDIIQGLKIVFKKNVVDIINEDLLGIKEIGNALGDKKLLNDINILLIKLKGHSNQTSEIQLDLLLLLHEVIKDYKRNRIMENHYTISLLMRQEEPLLSSLIVGVIHKLRDAAHTKSTISVNGVHQDIKKLESSHINDGLVKKIRTILKHIVDINDTSGRVQGELLPLLHDIIIDYMENTTQMKNYTISRILRREQPRLCEYIDDIIQGLGMVFTKNVVDLIDENLRGIKEIENALSDDKFVNDIQILLIKLKGRSNQTSEIQLELLLLLHEVIWDYKQNHIMENHYTISPLMRQEEPRLTGLIVDIIQKLRDASNTKTMISVNGILTDIKMLESSLKNDGLVKKIRTILKHIVDINDTSGRVQGELLPLLHNVINDYVKNAILGKNYTINSKIRDEAPELCQRIDVVMQSLQVVSRNELLYAVSEVVHELDGIKDLLNNNTALNKLRTALINIRGSTNISSSISKELFPLISSVINDFTENKIMEKNYTFNRTTCEKSPELCVLIESFVHKLQEISRNKIMEQINGIVVDISEIGNAVRNVSLIKKLEKALTNIRNSDNIPSGIGKELLPLISDVTEDFKQNQILEKNYTINQMTRKNAPELCVLIDALIQRLQEASRNELKHEINKIVAEINEIRHAVKNDSLIEKLVMTLTNIGGNRNIPSSISKELFPLITSVIDDFKQNNILNKNYTINIKPRKEASELCGLIDAIVLRLKNASRNIKGEIHNIVVNISDIRNAVKDDSLIKKLQKALTDIKSSKNIPSSVSVELFSLMSSAIKDFHQNRIMAKNYTINGMAREKASELCELIDAVINRLQEVSRKKVMDMINTNVVDISDINHDVKNNSLIKKLLTTLTNIRDSKYIPSSISKELLPMITNVLEDFKQNKILDKNYTINQTPRKEASELCGLIDAVILELQQATRNKMEYEIKNVGVGITDIRRAVQNDSLIEKLQKALTYIKISEIVPKTARIELFSLISNVIKDFKQNQILEKNYTINRITREKTRELCELIDGVIHRLQEVSRKNVRDEINSIVADINDINQAVKNDSLINKLLTTLTNIRGNNLIPSSLGKELLPLVSNAIGDFKENQILEKNYTINKRTRKAAPELCVSIEALIHQLQEVSRTEMMDLNKKIVVHIDELRNAVKNDTLIEKIEKALTNIQSSNNIPRSIGKELLPLVRNIVEDFKQNQIMEKNYTIDRMTKKHAPELCDLMEAFIHRLQEISRNKMMKVINMIVVDISEIKHAVQNESLIKKLLTSLNSIEYGKFIPSSIGKELLPLISNVINDFKQNEISEKNYSLNKKTKMKSPELCVLIETLIHRLKEVSRNKTMEVINDIVADISEIENAVRDKSLVEKLKKALTNIRGSKYIPSIVNKEILPMISNVVQDFKQNQILGKNYTVNQMTRKEYPELCVSIEAFINRLQEVSRNKTMDIIEKIVVAISEIRVAVKNESLIKKLLAALSNVGGSKYIPSSVGIYLLPLVNNVIDSFNQNEILEKNFTINRMARKESPELCVLIESFIQRLQEVSRKKTMEKINRIVSYISEIKHSIKNDSLIEKLFTALTNIGGSQNVPSSISRDLLPLINTLIDDFKQNEIFEKNHTINQMVKQKAPELCVLIQALIQRLQEASRNELKHEINKIVAEINEIRHAVKNDSLIKKLVTTLTNIGSSKNVPISIIKELLPLITSVVEDFKQNNILHKNYTISQTTRNKSPELSVLIGAFIHRLQEISRNKIMEVINKSVMDISEIKHHVKNDSLLEKVLTSLTNIGGNKFIPSSISKELLPLTCNVIEDFKQNEILKKNYTIDRTIRKDAPELYVLIEAFIHRLQAVSGNETMGLNNKIHALRNTVKSDALIKQIEKALTDIGNSSNIPSSINKELIPLISNVLDDFNQNQLLERNYTINRMTRKDAPEFCVLIEALIFRLQNISRNKIMEVVNKNIDNISEIRNAVKNDTLIKKLQKALTNIGGSKNIPSNINKEVLPMMSNVVHDFFQNQILGKNYTISQTTRTEAPELCVLIEALVHRLKVVSRNKTIEVVNDIVDDIREIRNAVKNDSLIKNLQKALTNIEGSHIIPSGVLKELLPLVSNVLDDFKQSQIMGKNYTINEMTRMESPELCVLIEALIHRLKEVSRNKTMEVVNDIVADISEIRNTAKNDSLIKNLQEALINIGSSNNMPNSVNKELIPLISKVLDDFKQNQLLENNYTINRMTRKDAPELCVSIEALIHRLQNISRNKMLEATNGIVADMSEISNSVKNDSLIKKLATKLTNIGSSHNIPNGVGKELLPLIRNAVEDFKQSQILGKNYTINQTTRKESPELCVLIGALIHRLKEVSRNKTMEVVNDIVADISEIRNAVKNDSLIKKLRKALTNIGSSKNIPSSINKELIPLISKVLDDFKQNQLLEKNYTINRMTRKDAPEFCVLIEALIHRLQNISRNKTMEVVNNIVADISETSNSVKNDSLVKKLEKELTNIGSSHNIPNGVGKELLPLIRKAVEDFKQSQILGKNYTINQMTTEESPELCALIGALIHRLKEVSRNKTMEVVNDIVADISEIRYAVENETLVKTLRNTLTNIASSNNVPSSLGMELRPLISKVIDDFNHNQILEKNYTIDRTTRNESPELFVLIESFIHRLQEVSRNKTMELINKVVVNINELRSPLTNDSLINKLEKSLINIGGSNNIPSSLSKELLPLIDNILKDFTQNHILERNYTINQTTRKKAPELCVLIEALIDRLMKESELAGTFNAMTGGPGIVPADIKVVTGIAVDYIAQLETIVNNLKINDNLPSDIHEELIPLLEDTIKDYIENGGFIRSHTIDPKLRTEHPELCRRVNEIIQELNNLPRNKKHQVIESNPIIVTPDYGSTRNTSSKIYGVIRVLRKKSNMDSTELLAALLEALLTKHQSNTFAHRWFIKLLESMRSEKVYSKTIGRLQNAFIRC